MQPLSDDFEFLASCAYLDTAAVGLTAPGAGQAAAHFLDAVKTRGVCAADEWRAKVELLRAQLAELLDASHGSCEFLSNTSEGLHLFARGLQWIAGDVIVLAEDEFPPVRHAWDHARAMGAEVRLVPVREERRREELLLAAIEPRVKLLAVSQVHSRTGTALNLERLGKECRRNGTILVVDGTQGVGAVPTTIRDVDVYSAAGFKWLAGPFGLGFVFVRDELRTRLRPTVIGAWNEHSSSDQVDLRYGHMNYPGIYALSAALTYLQSSGWENVFARTQQLTKYLHDGLHRCGIEPVAPLNQSAGITSFRLYNSADLMARAPSAQVQFSLREDMIRVSPHFYNGTAHIDRFLTLLDDLRGHQALAALPTK
jgi:cysteine desulfurase / selenocysteine lyase